MNTKSHLEALFFDFDGVVLDSNAIKTEGFRSILAGYESGDINAFLAYHEANGGISRYVKLRHFFSDILRRPADENEIDRLCNEFSVRMKSELSQKKYLIKDTLAFIESCHSKIPMHVVSGADEKELQYLCEVLGISHFFDSINGSPRSKEEILSTLLFGYGYESRRTVMIGDSINDLHAAATCETAFIGYNNLGLRNKGAYIESFKAFWECSFTIPQVEGGRP